ncbi:MAG: NADH-quinone oxidoreductase subunit C [Candidatus Accumulibacter sp.]|uniref:hydrogenase large subunit n=1 Tax=Accumulibacter sp. TaxID=2053492 RepID=UPI001A45AB60|nr:NADH-quinone oxidoreductase subunit C [Accumulibacter sp.]MBL8366937.1 NADH-quinone oxidoreductase subunit C [Accumulibacter sp.]MBN8514260.1 NADH-quinone oxidoreductase subunit C [Accumulibacter sp.]MBO3703711.1 NADH-quinone oxidoreductase subunit C [Accumulibacter sp.]
MRISGFSLDGERLPAPLPIWRATVRSETWQVLARALSENGGRLLTLWASDRTHGASGGLVISAAYAVPEGLLWLDLPLAERAATYPDLVPFFPCAGRLQRAAADLLGVVAEGVSDRRPWLDHGAWPENYRPLRRDQSPRAAGPHREVTDYAFVRVEGDGVHEIPVGPVHAGIIEPGHFRFSVVGEKVQRLEQRLGYKHKGIEKRFTELPALQAHRLAGRMSGDSTVAYGWAYCMALESLAGCEISERASWLRALLLERERVANHLGDLGALGNDAAFAFGLAQFSRLREDWLRLAKDAFGHRLMMDVVVPGGVTADVDQATAASLADQCDRIEREVQELRQIYDEHAGLQDRFLTTGRVSPGLAARLGLTGLAGRASGQAADLRCDRAWIPYDQLEVKIATQRGGDVAARVSVRFDEMLESLRLIRLLLSRLPDGRTRSELRLPSKLAFGAGWVEGWRGEVFVALEYDGEKGAHCIRRCHCHDPSWQNWPVLEHAVMADIVPDFPLINKSFNLSYSGHDL